MLPGPGDNLATRERASCPGPRYGPQGVSVLLVALLATGAPWLLSGERGQDGAVPKMAGIPAIHGTGAVVARAEIEQGLFSGSPLLAMSLLCKDFMALSLSLLTWRGVAAEGPFSYGVLGVGCRG